MYSVVHPNCKRALWQVVNGALKKGNINFQVFNQVVCRIQIRFTE